ncbi:MAG: hypothetical protein NT155_01890 [Candidatus Staskawiczbacteria bacterium]|nr:hypothetical protein [Candidatus Staskawiczbacteria bacterium]
MLNDNDIQKLIKAQREVFATKEDVENLIDIVATKEEFAEFKDEFFDKQDEIITKLDALTQEKTIGDDQDKRQKKVLEIHTGALKSKGVLSEEQALEIDKLRVF